MSKVCSLKELTSFISQLGDTLSTHPTSETLAALHGALEELQIAEETLHEQAAQLQSALQQADTERHRYLELFEFAPDAYYVTDKNGAFLELNHAACELLQEDAAAILGKPMFIFIRPDQKNDVRNFVAHVVEKSSSESSPARVRSVFQTELVLGKATPLYISARCCLSSDALKGPRLLWMWRDITEQKQVQDNLRLMTKKLERTVEDKKDELQQRIEELEAFHDVAVGRELRLMELEKKLKKFQSEEH